MNLLKTFTYSFCITFCVLTFCAFTILRDSTDSFTLHVDNGSALEDWLFGKFTKVCVGVSSEEELVAIYTKAKEQGLICSLIVDAGLTEFNNEPTITCCAIGPNWSDEIDPLTQHLKLL